MQQTSRKALVAACHRLDALRFVVATDGNVSIRNVDGSITMTPSGLNKGRVTEEDLVVLRMDGTQVSRDRTASSENDMHRFIYEVRTDVHAVVHAHPTYATAFAAARVPLTMPVFPEVILTVGPVPIADYATPSTHEILDSIAPHVRNCNALLLANHGAVTMGATLDEAMARMEKLEHFAQMIFLARQLGGEKPLTEEELGRLKKAFSIDPEKQHKSPSVSR
jgi:L-fuculose-phosphate aldolase